MIIMMMILSTAISCCSPEDPEPPGDMNRLVVRWRTSLIPENSTMFSESMNPVLHDSMIVINTQASLNGLNYPVLFIDTGSGEIQDYWSDYIDGPSPTTYYGEKTGYSSPYLFLGGQTSINCVNLNTRQTQWSGMVTESTPYLYVDQTYLYRGVEYINGSMIPSAAIMRTPLSQQSWDTLFSFSKTDQFNPSFDALEFALLQNGDEIVVWKNRSYSGSSNRTDVFCYNISADSVVWRNSDLLGERSGRIPPVIDAGSVYVAFEKVVAAFDIQDGTMLWSIDLSTLGFTLPVDMYEGDIHLEGGVLLVRCQSDELLALNAQSGSVEWIKEGFSYGLDDRFTYFEGKLFFSASGMLYIVDPITGENLISDYRNRHLGQIQGGIVIDETRRVMYMDNGQELLCVDIPSDI